MSISQIFKGSEPTLNETNDTCLLNGFLGLFKDDPVEKSSVRERRRRCFKSPYESRRFISNILFTFSCGKVLDIVGKGIFEFVEVFVVCCFDADVSSLCDFWRVRIFFHCCFGEKLSSLFEFWCVKIFVACCFDANVSSLFEFWRVKTFVACCSWTLNSSSFFQPLILLLTESKLLLLLVLLFLRLKGSSGSIALLLSLRRKDGTNGSMTLWLYLLLNLTCLTCWFKSHLDSFSWLFVNVDSSFPELIILRVLSEFWVELSLFRLLPVECLRNALLAVGLSVADSVSSGIVILPRLTCLLCNYEIIVTQKANIKITLWITDLQFDELISLKGTPSIKECFSWGYLRKN